ncbi:hypothetical protein NUW54_g6893 [Trametes sanguinea]|uniref:Uncharacterized protein n=1 Tax=Trametes sanguinea TaxID=158606 RepID=A0ACC1PTX7_9APHY|nr:hypothetical protein NUW54_g6893 [Trametes sanguinea]
MWTGATTPPALLFKLVICPSQVSRQDGRVHHLFRLLPPCSDLSYLLDRLEALEDDPMPRKRTAGDRPLLQWLSEIPGYLDELLRLEGRGDFADRPCSKCGLLTDDMYRCIDCDDLALTCRRESRVSLSSLHVHVLTLSKRWQDGCFNRVSLKSLGLRVQLGHELGEKCINPIPAPGDDFVLLDNSGVHEISVDFCGDVDQPEDGRHILVARKLPTPVPSIEGQRVGVLSDLGSSYGEHWGSLYGIHVHDATVEALEDAQARRQRQCTIWHG